ncbi:hypothetical protein ABRP53_07030 [Corynebacterium marquesiae]|uniref:hypothetical protein n=1 Tax=Corynebacterium marquesiae TaxID=2913503 RepID=UPI0032EE48AF
MNVTVEDRLIYIRELTKNLTGCAMDTLAGAEVEESVCEEIGEILYALSEDVDGEASASGLSRRQFYSHGMPAYERKEDGWWLNHPERGHGIGWPSFEEADGGEW